MNRPSIYFIGAGGIGMSALVRYFLAKNYRVAGYDKTATPLTQALIEEGAEIHYEDSVNLIPSYCKDINTIVVRTPAVPVSHSEYCWFKENGFKILKRAELLGEVTKMSKALCIAGTHGKTTTSTMLAHILKQSKVDCNAFLGGIVKNYSSNLMLSEKSELTVIEADEYDRSFHHLHPYMAVITSSDPDHLDIYGDEKSYLESFEHFTSLISSDGILLLKKGLKIKPRLKEGVKQYTYSIDKGADFHAENIRIGNGTILFDMVSPIKNIKDIELGVPVWINIENSIAAMAIAQLNGVDEDELRSGIKSYQGAKRRFDFWTKNERHVLIDDYGHHPEEVNASIKSVKQLFENRKLTVIFQPHLYSRTKDFYKEFAKALSLADEVLLLDIYPAREEPIEGVTSDIIFKLIESDQKKRISKEELLDYIKANNFDVLMTLGAGDIDLMLPEIQKIIDKR